MRSVLEVVVVILGMCIAGFGTWRLSQDKYARDHGVLVPVRVGAPLITCGGSTGSDILDKVCSAVTLEWEHNGAIYSRTVEPHEVTETLLIDATNGERVLRTPSVVMSYGLIIVGLCAAIGVVADVVRRARVPN